MLRRKRDDGHAERPPADALDRLVEAERQHEQALATAQEDAARTVAEARAAAARADEEFDGELKRAIAALDAQFARDLEAELAAAAERARGRALWYERVGEDRVRDLARRIIETLTRTDSRPADGEP